MSEPEEHVVLLGTGTSARHWCKNRGIAFSKVIWIGHYWPDVQRLRGLSGKFRVVVFRDWNPRRSLELDVRQMLLHRATDGVTYEHEGVTDGATIHP